MLAINRLCLTGANRATNANFALLLLSPCPAGSSPPWLDGSVDSAGVSTSTLGFSHELDNAVSVLSCDVMRAVFFLSGSTRSPARCARHSFMCKGIMKGFTCLTAVCVCVGLLSLSLLEHIKRLLPNRPNLLTQREEPHVFLIPCQTSAESCVEQR